MLLQQSAMLQSGHCTRATRRNGSRGMPVPLACLACCIQPGTPPPCLLAGWLGLTAARRCAACGAVWRACMQLGRPSRCCLVSHPGRPSLGLPFSIVASLSTLQPYLRPCLVLNIELSHPRRLATPPRHSPVANASPAVLTTICSTTSCHHPHLPTSNQDTTPRWPSISTD